jgi:hypothetical protein
MKIVWLITSAALLAVVVCGCKKPVASDPVMPDRAPLAPIINPPRREEPKRDSPIIGKFVHEDYEASKFVMFYIWMADGTVEQTTLTPYDDQLDSERGTYKLDGDELSYTINTKWDGARWAPMNSRSFIWKVKLSGDRMEIEEYGTGGRGLFRRVSDAEVKAIEIEVEKHRQAQKGMFGN